MAGQRKILLDSNSYFRLACSIHPLLFEEFGDDRVCLYVCPDLDREYKRSARLKTRFHWVVESRYVENRKRKISLSKKNRTEITSTLDFLRSFVFDIEFPKSESIPSEVDLEILAMAATLMIPVVTDDRAMHRVAGQFGVETLSTLELLKLMLDRKHVTKEKVIEIASYWIYENDLPARFREEWKAFFDFRIPTD